MKPKKIDLSFQHYTVFSLKCTYESGTSGIHVQCPC